MRVCEVVRGAWEWFCIGSRCGSIGRDAWVLVLRCVLRIIEKSFLERVAYWWVVGGGQDLGGWRMARNGEILSGCCWSGGGTRYWDVDDRDGSGYGWSRCWRLEVCLCGTICGLR
jgi:hypothetical protein